MAEQALSIEERISSVINEPEPEPAPEAAPEASAAPVEETPTETPPADAAPAQPPVEAPPEGEPEQTTEAAAETTDDGDVEEVDSLSLRELADTLGAEEADLYSALRIPVTNADGTKGEVTLSEWKDAYQAHHHYRQEEAAVKEARATFQQEQTEARAKIEAQIQEAAGVLQVAERHLMGDVERVNWDNLRDEDPAEYAVRRQEYTERANELQRAKGELLQQAERYQAEQEANASRQQIERLAAEREALLVAFPEWRDEKKRTAAQSQIREFLGREGFTQEEIGSFVDHRAVKLIEMARKWHEHVTNGGAVKRKVLKVAKKKPLKPGAAQSRSDIAQDSVAQAARRLHSTGSVEDAAAVISARWNQPRR